MARYHDSGTICEARLRACPLGLSESDHIEADSKQEFEAKLAEKVASEGDSFGTSSKSAEAPQEHHPWAGTVLAYANSLPKDPAKGDWVAYEDSYSGGKLRSGKVVKIGRKGGMPYVQVAPNSYDAPAMVWPEGAPGNAKRKSSIAVRARGVLGGEESWYPRIGAPIEEFEEEIKSWDEVDFVLYNGERERLTSESYGWDNPDQQMRYRESWKKRYALVDQEMELRRESGDLGPRKRPQVQLQEPGKAGPAKGSIASYRAMDEKKIQSEYSSQSQRWFDGGGRGDLAKIEKVMAERGISGTVPLRTWD